MAAFASSASLKQLNERRIRLEAEAEGIKSELVSTGAGVSDPLVDREGFPRADIDVYRVRELRQRLAVINTDHKDMMKQIEAAVLRGTQTTLDEEEARKRPKPKPKYDAVRGAWVVANWDGTVAGVEGGENLNFNTDIVTDKAEAERIRATMGVEIGSEQAQQSQQSQQQQPPRASLDTRTPPFATVETVEAHSPARNADLRPGDKIVSFGKIKNVTDFKSIGPLVQNAAANGEAVELLVVRDQQRNVRVTLTLRPMPWAGRGNLGAYITPIVQ